MKCAEKQCQCQVGTQKDRVVTGEKAISHTLSEKKS